jgi:hypothetical protein
LQLNFSPTFTRALILSIRFSYMKIPQDVFSPNHRSREIWSSKIHWKGITYWCWICKSLPVTRAQKACSWNSQSNCQRKKSSWVCPFKDNPSWPGRMDNRKRYSDSNIQVETKSASRKISCSDWWNV